MSKRRFKYGVEEFDNGWHTIECFETKKEAVAFIQAEVDKGDRYSYDYRITVEITFKVKEKK